MVTLLFWFCFFFLSLCVCFELCVWSCGRGGHEQPKKKGGEEKDEEEKQHEEQLEEVSPALANQQW